MQANKWLHHAWVDIAANLITGDANFSSLEISPARPVFHAQRAVAVVDIVRRGGDRDPYRATMAAARHRYCSSRQISQHIMQDAAVQEIFQLVDGIDAAACFEALNRSVGAG